MTVTLKGPKEWTRLCYLTSTCKSAAQGLNALLSNVHRMRRLTRSHLAHRLTHFKPTLAIEFILRSH